MDPLSRKVAERLFIHLDLLIPVRAAVFDGFHYREALNYAPAHSETLYVLPQLGYLLSCPYFAKRNIVKGGYNALHPYLFQHGKGDSVVLAKPAPGSFHIILLYLQRYIFFHLQPGCKRIF